jgi:cyclic pyranopterin monophosphate synthase
MKSQRALQLRKPEPGFSQLDAHGAARMVDVGHKPMQRREAAAIGRLACQPATLRALLAQDLPKGDVLAVANLAALQAVKQTASLIPLCHPLPIEHAALDFRLGRNWVEVTCTVAAHARTGVEMEALTWVSVALLALYDMCKAVDKTMRIEGIRVTRKVKR